MNLFVEAPDYGRLTSMHFYAWKKGLKTGMYYLRTRPAADAIPFTVDPASAASRNGPSDEEGGGGGGRGGCGFRGGCDSVSPQRTRDFWGGLYILSGINARAGDGEEGESAPGSVVRGIVDAALPPPPLLLGAWEMSKCLWRYLRVLLNYFPGFFLSVSTSWVLFGFLRCF